MDNGRKINVDYFYRLLCTDDNLNLIHDDCEPHSYKGYNVDDSKMFMDEEDNENPMNSNNLAEQIDHISLEREMAMGGKNEESSSPTAQ